MYNSEIQTKEMLARVAQFGPKHADLFPSNEVPGETFFAIGQELAKISGLASIEVSNLHSSLITGKVRLAARKTLRKLMDRMVKTAPAVLIDNPVLTEKFRMPARRKDSDLIHAGASFVTEAEPFKKEFLAHRLPIEKLSAAVQNLETAIQTQATQKEAGANARKSIKTTMTRCLTLLQRIDAIVMNTLADKPEILAEWEVTRRVVRKPATRSRKDEATPETQSQSQAEAETKSESQADVASSPVPAPSPEAAPTSTA